MPRALDKVQSDITPKVYDEIVKVFAKHDGSILRASLELRWPIARTRRIWMRGYPSMGYPAVRTLLGRDPLTMEKVQAGRRDLELELPPSVEIKNEEELSRKAVVISEGEAARVRALVRREEERQKAREDAVKARSEEAMLISIARRNALALNGLTANVLRGAMSLSASIQEQLEREAREGSTLTVREKLALVKSAASIARFNAEATVLSVKAERQVLAQPIDAPGEAEGGGDLDEAVDWIRKSVKAIEAAQQRGLLTSGKKST